MEGGLTGGGGAADAWSGAFSGRERVWDVLRGAGVLGIFLVHGFVFSSPSTEPLARRLSWSADWPYLLSSVVANGKFIALLAATFGAGFAMMYARDVASGRTAGEARLRLVRRCVVLLGLGVLHYVLLFWGDILQWYGLVGLAAVWLVGRSGRVLLGVAVAGVALAGVAGTAVMGLQAAAMLLAPQDLQAWAREEMEQELAVFGAGSYLTQVSWRLAFYPYLVVQYLAEVPLILGLMAAGMWVWRRGYLTRPSAHPSAVRWTLGVGLGVGVPLNVLAVLSTHPVAMLLLLYVQRVFGGVLLGAALAMLLATAVERGAAGRVTGLLACVGRRALSCYVLQSVLANVLFYSWGLGLYGQLTPLQKLGVVAGVWTAVVAAAVWAERSGVRGPLEWAWRKLAPTR